MFVFINTIRDVRNEYKTLQQAKVITRKQCDAETQHEAKGWLSEQHSDATGKALNFDVVDRFVQLYVARFNFVFDYLCCYPSHKLSQKLENLKSVSAEQAQKWLDLRYEQQNLKSNLKAYETAPEYFKAFSGCRNVCEQSNYAWSGTDFGESSVKFYYDDCPLLNAGICKGKQDNICLYKDKNLLIQEKNKIESDLAYKNYLLVNFFDKTR